MGVHTLFFSFDEAYFAGLRPGPLTIDVLDELGAFTEEDDVGPRFAGRLEEIETHMSHNKQWYNNLAADSVYARLRGCLPAEVRARTDGLFRLLFWEGALEPDDRPTPVPPPHHDPESSCYVYGPETVAYLAAQDPSLEEIRPVFDECMEGWDMRGDEWLRNVDDFDTFQWWVDSWLTVFQKAAAGGGGAPRTLLVHVSY